MQYFTERLILIKPHFGQLHTQIGIKMTCQLIVMDVKLVC